MSKLLQATVRDRSLYVTLQRRTGFSAGRALTQSELAPEHANQTQLTMRLAMLTDARTLQPQTSWTVVSGVNVYGHKVVHDFPSKTLWSVAGGVAGVAGPVARRWRASWHKLSSLKRLHVGVEHHWPVPRLCG